MKDKKKVKIYYGLLITLIIFAGVSYAWFRLTKTQENKNVIGTRSCLDTTLTEETSNIVLDDAFPISDEDGMKQTPFTFTLKNNCEGYVKVYITIDSKYRESASTDYLKDDYVKANLSTKGTTTGQSTLLANNQLIDLENNNKGYILVSTGLKANEEKSYDLRIWVDSETTLEQGLNKSWEGKIVVVGEAAKATLSNIILADNEIKEPLTVPGKEVSAHTLDEVAVREMSVSDTYQNYYFIYGTEWEASGTKFDLTGINVTSDTYANSYSEIIGKYLIVSPGANQFFLSNNYNVIETPNELKTGIGTGLSSVVYVVNATSSSFTYKQISSSKGVTEAEFASAKDDYGTSYYFRGAVKNNYVEFANKCWRIVRITGDGSVKLVLFNDNSSGLSSPCSSSNNNAKASFIGFSYFNSSRDDNAYIGFMYGQAGASDYATTHANINKSTILTNLETWYTNNLMTYENKLADIIWCNDKSTVSGGPGYGTETTYYGAENRLRLQKTPSLICPNDNNGGKLSKFTVNDTLNGNGALDYKIGLLTADEIIYAGFVFSYAIVNSSTYLSENTGEAYWWTMTPRVFYLNSNGQHFTINFDYSVGNLAVSGKIRPAIALKSNVEISGGTGTSEDPYVVN